MDTHTQDHVAVDNSSQKELKEDFSGFTEVTVRDQVPPVPPVPPGVTDEGNSDVSDNRSDSPLHHEQHVDMVCDPKTQVCYPSPAQPRNPLPVIPPSNNSMFNKLYILPLVIIIGFIVWWFLKSKKTSIVSGISEAIKRSSEVLSDAVTDTAKSLKLPPKL